METYYFTFGTDPKFPFERGWVEVQAFDELNARRIFSLYFPSRKDGCLNCAFVYSENSFKKTGMYQGKYGDKCHARIRLEVLE